jgi:hypothetical protein
MMHRGSVDHRLGLRRAQTCGYRFQARELNVLVRKSVDVIALIRKSADNITAKLTVGSDHSDLHATSASNLTGMEIFMTQPFTESSASCSE